MEYKSKKGNDREIKTEVDCCLVAMRDDSEKDRGKMERRVEGQEDEEEEEWKGRRKKVLEEGS